MGLLGKKYIIYIIILVRGPQGTTFHAVFAESRDDSSTYSYTNEHFSVTKYDITLVVHSLYVENRENY